MQGLGKRIQKCREEAGMTQEALAERVGISWNYLGAIEREVKTPKLETLVRIINVLGMSADDVMLDVFACRAEGAVHKVGGKASESSKRETG